MAESGPWDDFKKTEVGPWMDYRRRSPKQMSASDDPNNVGLLNAMQSLDEGATKAGGWVTDKLAGKVPPQVAGTAGMLTKMLPDIATLPLSALGGAKAVGVPLAKMAKPAAEWMMGWSLAPTTKQWASGEGPAAVKKMLESNTNVSVSGIAKLKKELEGYWKGVDELIANSPDSAPRSVIENGMRKALDIFKGGPEEKSAIEAIKQTIKEFRETPSLKRLNDFPMDVLQRYKKLTYRMLDDSYGMLGAPKEEALKGGARAAKEAMEAKLPELKGLNAKEQEIYKTLPVLERKAMQQLSANPQHLALLAHDPKAAAGVVLGRTPLFTSWLANRLNQFANSMVPQGIGAAGGIGLHEIGKERNVFERPPY